MPTIARCALQCIQRRRWQWQPPWWFWSRWSELPRYMKRSRSAAIGIPSSSPAPLRTASRASFQSFFSACILVVLRSFPGRRRDASLTAQRMTGSRPFMSTGLRGILPAVLFPHHKSHFGRYPMPFTRGTILRILPILFLALAVAHLPGQGGSAGIIRGTITDPSGAVIPNATVHLTNPRSGLDRTATSDALGQFEFSNITFDSYQIAVSANGFAAQRKAVDIHSVVGTTVKLVMQIASADSTVTVEAQGDLVENDPTFHTDVDREDFIKVPLESASSGLKIGR